MSPKCLSFTSKNTGGEYVHKLTVNEIPKHKHTANYSNNTTTSDTLNWGFDWHYGVAGTSDGAIYSTGGSGSHNNIQPYVVTYMFKRIS